MQGAAMLEDERRASIRRLCAAPATPLEDAPSRRGRRSHGQLSYDANHLKFWSVESLGELLRDAGFVDVRFERVGRVPALAKSMIASARKA